MIFAKPHPISLPVVDNLRHLFDLLREQKTQFENLAASSAGHQLKITIRCLAQECHQYAQEVSAQLSCLGGRANHAPVMDGDNGSALMAYEPDLLHTCLIMEKNMIVAYRHVLNEPALHEQLRALLRTQLNGITCAFIQLKLLKAAMSKR